MFLKKIKRLTAEEQRVNSMVLELNINDDLRSVFRAIAIVARKSPGKGPLLVQISRRTEIPKRACKPLVQQLLGLGLIKGYYDENEAIRYTLRKQGEKVARKISIHL